MGLQKNLPRLIYPANIFNLGRHLSVLFTHPIFNGCSMYTTTAGRADLEECHQERSFQPTFLQTTPTPIQICCWLWWKWRQERILFGLSTIRSLIRKKQKGAKTQLKKTQKAEKTTRFSNFYQRTEISKLWLASYPFSIVMASVEIKLNIYTQIPHFS